MKRAGEVTPTATPSKRTRRTDIDKSKIFNAAIAFSTGKYGTKKKTFLDEHGKSFGLDSTTSSQDFSSATQVLTGNWPTYAKEFLALKEKGEKISMKKFAEEKVTESMSDRAKAKLLGTAVKIQEYKDGTTIVQSAKKTPKKPKVVKKEESTSMFGSMWSFVKGVLPF